MDMFFVNSKATFIFRILEKKIIEILMIAI